MNEKEKLINALIDKHYSEDYDINLLNRLKSQEHVNSNNDTLDKSMNVTALENKIHGALSKMDLANSIDFNFDIDTLNIIQTAAQIQTKKNSIKENIFFLMSSILILSLFSIVFIKFGIKFLIYFQLFLVFIMPWSLIPLSKHALRRNENE
mgnify:CR=1 FL=1